MTTRSPFHQPDAPDTSYVEMTEQQLVRRHDEEWQRQEAALDEIHLGAKGLTHAAHAINHEVVDSTQLIGDIDHRLDKAQVDLERGERQARAVNALKGKTCKLYVIIVLLVVAEVVLTACHVPLFDFKCFHHPEDHPDVC